MGIRLRVHVVHPEGRNVLPCQHRILPPVIDAVIEMLVLPVTSLLILVASVELPLYILLGREKGNLAKVAIILLFVFVIIGFMLFADISWLTDKENYIIAFYNWYTKHLTEMTLISYLSPVIDLFIFYLSYRITVYFKARQEA